MRGRRRIHLIVGAGSTVKPTLVRHGFTYHLRKGALGKIPGTVEAIYTLPGIPAEPMRRRPRKFSGKLTS